MPTPFYHISVALELLKPEILPKTARRFLIDNQGAFLFGSTAPDVQVVSGEPRESTHFFEIPVQSTQQPAWENLLEYYPILTSAANLTPAHVSFLAGYLIHLQADWLWVLQIYQPVFGPQVHWATFRKRLFLHNVLRSYIDREILPGLNIGISGAFLDAHPEGWLPFVEDRFLITWRNELAQQLRPRADIRTIDVFASRQGIPLDEYSNLLNSEERMEQEIFTHLPRTELSEYRQHLLEENMLLLANFLGKTSLM